MILGHFLDKFARCQTDFLKRLKVARCQKIFARCQASLLSAKFGTWHPFSQHWRVDNAFGSIGPSIGQRSNYYRSKVFICVSVIYKGLKRIISHHVF